MPDVSFIGDFGCSRGRRLSLKRPIFVLTQKRKLQSIPRYGAKIVEGLRTVLVARRSDGCLQTWTHRVAGLLARFQDLKNKGIPIVVRGWNYPVAG